MCIRKPVLFLALATVLVSCAHANGNKEASGLGSVRILIGLPDAPSRVVTIDTDGRFSYTTTGGTHIGPSKTRTGRLLPGESNDIALSIAEAGFWEWLGEPETVGVSGTVLEVQVGERLHRVFEPGVSSSHPSKLQVLVERIVSFTHPGA